MAYIKKEPIVEFITKGLNNPDKTKAYGYDAIEILTEIEYAPEADVVEVVHGEWKKPQFSGRRGFYSVKDFVCNKCGGAFGIEQGNLLMNYCPNCGAKMDGGKAE